MTSRLTTSRAGHAYAIDGERVPSVTTIIGNAIHKRALMGWAAREAAHWAATHVDLLDPMGEADWIEQASKAHTKTSNKKAARGTDVHRDAEALLAGDAVDIPDDRLAITRQAVDFMDAWHVNAIAAERPCYNAEWQYAGTFDLIAELADGATWLLDWKTGSGPWPDQTLQLAAYAACPVYVDADGSDNDMPHIDRMGFVMLTDDGWDLVPVVADAERLFNVFTRMIGVSTFVQWTTPNRDGVARWPVVGEPVLPAVSA